MPDREPHRLVIVTGLSGAGKTVALNMLEDLGYYCVDNVPAKLLREFARSTVAMRDPAYRWMAIGVDARNRPEEIVAIPQLREELGKLGVATEIIYLRSEPEVLFKRYSETRRRHPLSAEGVDLRGAIARESELLAPLLERADLMLDTSHTNLHELRDIVRERVHRIDTRSMSLQFESFAYRHGLPPDADFVFDVRCLPNPHWDAALRPLTGRDPAVVAHLDAQPEAGRMVEDIAAMLERWIPTFEGSNRSYLTVAIGCTGGQHRSVYVVERLAERFTDRFGPVTVRHKELGR
jgi:UPF0042 nucleotide-binding protein